MAGGLSKYRDEIIALSGVDIMLDENTYKDMFQIFTELAAVWDKMNGDAARSRVAEILGGTRQLSGIMSTINNIADAQGAYADALNSSGVAMEANDKRMETTEAHIGQLKASYQELSSDIFDSDTMKMAVDALRGLVETLDYFGERVGVVGLALGAFGIELVGTFTKGAVAADSMAGGFAALSSQLTGVANALGLTSAAAGGIFTIVTAIGLIALAYDALNESEEELNQKLENSFGNYDVQTNKLQEVQRELESNKQALEALENVDDTEYVSDDELEKLRESVRLLEIQEEIEKRRQADAAREAADTYVDTFKKIYGENATTADGLKAQLDESKGSVFWQDVYDDTQNNIPLLIAEIEMFKEKRDALLDPKGEDAYDFQRYSDLVTEYEGIASDHLDTLIKQRNNLQTLVNAGYTLTEDQREALAGTDALIDFLSENLGIQIDDVLDKANNVSETVRDAQGAIVDTTAAAMAGIRATATEAGEKIKAYSESVAAIREAISNQSTGKTLDFDIYNSDELKAYTGALEYHNGVLQYNLDKVNEITAALAEQREQEIKTEKTAAQSRYVENAKEIMALRSMRNARGGDAISNMFSDISGAANDATMAVADFSDSMDLDAHINALEAENEEILTLCSGYDVMVASIGAALSAYQNWINAQDASQAGDMFDGAVAAFNHINDTLNDSESDFFGRIGRSDYKAAIDFIIPETVDGEDTEQVNKYLKSINDLLVFDDKGNLTGLDISAFLKKSVDEGLMTVDESGEDFKIAGSKTMEDFAEGLNLSLPLVQAIFGELEEYGGKFDWADEVDKSLGDLAVEAYEAADALTKLKKNKNMKIIMDVSGFDNPATAISTLQSTVSQMQEYRAKLSVDSTEYQQANSIIEYCMLQIQALQAPVILRVDTSKVQGELGEALGLLQEFKAAQDIVEMQTSLNMDTTEAQAEVDALATQIASNTYIKANLGLNDGSVEEINQAIAGLTEETLITLGVDSSLIDGYEVPEKTAKVKFEKDSSAVDNYQPKTKTAYINFEVGGKFAIDNYLNSLNNIRKTITFQLQTSGSIPTPRLPGVTGVNGTAHGKAAASGNWGTTASAKTLVGELGTEIVVDPKSGMWYTVGDNGPEFRYIPKGSIVFNHLQTESLLKNGYAIGRAAALASGTAMVTGGIKWKDKYNPSGSSSSSSSKTPSKSSSSSTTPKSSKSTGSKETDELLKGFQDWLAKFFDWVEVKIARVADKIDAAASKAQLATDSGNYTSASKSYAKAIDLTATQAYNEQRANARYQQQANLVMQRAIESGLISRSQANSIIKLDKNGAIDIAEYGERVREVVSAYQQWMDKAREASKSLQDLHTNVREYVRSIKDLRDAQRDARLQLADNRETIGTSSSNWMTSMASNQLKYIRDVLTGNRGDAYQSETNAIASTVNTLGKSGKSSISGQLAKSVLSNLSKSERKKYKKALNNAKKAVSKKVEISSSDMSVIRKHSIATYERLYAYNVAVQALEEARYEQAVNYAEITPEVYDNTREIYENLDNRVDDNISLLRQRSENATSASSKNYNLDRISAQYDTLLKNDQKEIDEYNKMQTSASKTIRSKGWAGTSYSSLNTTAREKVKNAINKAREYAKSGKPISPAVLNTLATYYSKGYVTFGFYQACINYNNALDSKNQALSQQRIDMETVKQERDALGVERMSNVRQEYDNQTNRLESAANMLSSLNNTKTTRGLSLTADDYSLLIKNSAAQMKIYSDEVDALNKVINENLSNGYWTENSQSYLDALLSVEEYKVKVQDCVTEQEELNNAVAQLPYNTIEAFLDLLDAISKYHESVSSLKAATGEDLLEEDYLTQIDDNTKKIEQYTKERLLAYEDMLKAESNADRVYGGKTADQWRATWNTLGATINELKEANEGLKDSLRDDVYWRNFERAHDTAERLRTVLEGIQDLIGDDMYFDKNGFLTEYGVAQIANLTKQFENARTEVENYSNDIANLNRLYEEGQYTTLEYNEKLADLQEGLLGSASDMKDLIDEIKDIYKDLDQAELDSLFKLIDARNDALSAKKEYYDYDKTIREKTKDIQELTAQIAALNGVSTAEAKAQRAKFEEQLAKAEEELAETQRDHSIELSQNALSDLKDTLQEEFDLKWDYLWQNLDDVKGLLEAANTLTVSNTAAVRDSLAKLLSFYGIDAGATGVDKAYASGIRRVGSHVIGLSSERGNEIIVTKDGIISHFNPGDGVVPADLTERLYQLAENVKPGAGLGVASLASLRQAGGGLEVTQNYGSLINIEGSADAATVEDLKRLGSELLEKSYNYTTRRISQDYVRTGGVRRI